jgi:hypothetical protein
VESKLVFIAFTVLAVIAIPAIAGGLVTVIGHFAGMRRGTLLALVGSAVAATAAAVIGMASVIAHVLFS